MSQASSLAVKRPDPYVYRAAWKRAAAACLDAAGELLFGLPDPRPIPWKDVRKVAVLRLDHLGDVIQCLPAVAALKKALPKAQVDLFVGPWGRDIAGMAGVADHVEVFEAPWFWRPARWRWPWAAIGGLAQRLKQGGYQVGLEMRGDLRHHMALWSSGIPFRAGFALTAGRFLLTHPARADNSLHELEQNLNLLAQSGLPVSKSGATAHPLVPGPEARKQADRVFKELKLKGKVIALQAACGTRAKRWPAERWAELIDRLGTRRTCVLLGSSGEMQEMKELAALCRHPPVLATGRFDIPTLAAFLQKCALMISVDSGPAHLAAGVGTPVLAIYSGTNLATQWGPRGRKVEILRHLTPCTPCELTVCPFGNACTAGIPAETVHRRALHLLGGK